MKPINAQLTGAISAVKSADKFEQLKHIIPQRLEDGKLYNFNDVCIGQHDAPDEVFTDANIEAPSRFTQAFVQRITDPVQKLIDVSEAPTETKADAETTEKKKDKKKDKKSNPVDLDKDAKDRKDRDVINIGEIKDLLAKGDKKSVKKAKKAFEAQFDEDHPNYDELKKAIKKAKKAL